MWRIKQPLLSQIWNNLKFKGDHQEHFIHDHAKLFSIYQKIGINHSSWSSFYELLPGKNLWCMPTVDGSYITFIKISIIYLNIKLRMLKLIQGSIFITWLNWVWKLMLKGSWVMPLPRVGTCYTKIYTNAINHIISRHKWFNIKNIVST